ncbi:MAG: hypothetical protein QF477_12735, partial [SAR202 cluster bacterium]|nr:hypothetical protein [SAR202 cluster bacterium]
MNLKLAISFLLPAAFMLLLVACGGGSQIADTSSPEAEVVAKAIVEPAPTNEPPKPEPTKPPAPEPTSIEVPPTPTATPTPTPIQVPPTSIAKVVEASFATTPSLEIECGNTTNQTTVAVSEGAGVWSQIRGDRALTGKSELIGSITC